MIWITGRYLTSIANFLKRQIDTIWSVLGLMIIGITIGSIFYSIYLVIDLGLELGSLGFIKLLINRAEQNLVTFITLVLILAYFVMEGSKDSGLAGDDGGVSEETATPEHLQSTEGAIEISIQTDVGHSVYSFDDKSDIREILNTVEDEIQDYRETSGNGLENNGTSLQTDGGKDDRSDNSPIEGQRLGNGIPITAAHSPPIDQVSRAVPIRILVAWIFVKSTFGSNLDSVETTLLWGAFALLLIGAFLLLVRQTSPHPNRPLVTELRHLPKEIDDQRIGKIGLAYTTLVVWAISLGAPFSTMSFYNRQAATAFLGLYTILFLPTFLQNPPKSSHGEAIA